MNANGWRQMSAPAPVRTPEPARLVKLVEEVGAGASCMELGVPDWWTPHGGSAAVAQAVSRALVVCAGCPVADQCLELAAGSGEGEHVWGQVALSHRLDAAEALARVRAGQPVRAEMLEEAVSAAATRNLEDDYGAQWLTMGRGLRAQLHAQERGRLRELIGAGRVEGQVRRDVVSWEVSPWADMDLVEDQFVEAEAVEAAASWMPQSGSSSAA